MENQRMSAKKLNAIRIGVLVACCLVFTLKIVIGPKYKIYRPFTQWGLMLTIIFYILMLSTSQCKPNHRIIQILFQTTWNLNFLISLTYWAILLPIKLIFSSIKLGSVWDLIYGFTARRLNYRNALQPIAVHSVLYTLCILAYLCIWDMRFNCEALWLC